MHSKLAKYKNNKNLSTLQGMHTQSHDPKLSAFSVPGEYPRRILLAVSGLSPQVVTETLYALATQTDGSMMPTDVHIITTLEGAQRAELSLLSDDLGWFHKLCKDYDLPPIAFNRDHIHVIKDASGSPMDDIRSLEDNSAAANYITAMVRDLSADPQSALHVSIAGGRKTIGFYLGYALSLFGRSQDRLSHVLVSEPFENSLDFFYPTPYSRVIQTHDKKWADTCQAKVTLAQIPFVSLRNDLPHALLQGQASFSETVAEAQRALAPPELRIDLNAQKIWAGGQEVELAPTELALLAAMARHTQEGKPPLGAPEKSTTAKQFDLVWGERLLVEYERIKDERNDGDSTVRTLREGMTGEYFSELKSKLTKNLKKALGPAHIHYIIYGQGRPGKFSLRLKPETIHFVGKRKGMPHTGLGVDANNRHRT